MNNKWKSEPIGKIIKTTSGGTPDKKHLEYYGGDIPWVRSGELDRGIIKDTEVKITREGLENSSAKIFPAGTLLLALYGATIGKLAFLGIPAATNQAVCALFENDILSLRYLYYFLLFKRPELIKQGIGGAQPNISQTIVKKCVVSYPESYIEQERIVARIEELFSELDNAEATLQATKQQLAVYRQAVLKDAFEGKYTSTWRKEHPNNEIDNLLNALKNRRETEGNNKIYAPIESVELHELPKNWRWISIGDITNGVEYGTSRKSLKKGRIPVLRMGNMKKGLIDWNDLVYSDDVDEINRYLLKANDVLFNRTNSSEHVGKTSIYKGEQPAIFAGYIIRINQFQEINASYLTYYMNSFVARNYAGRVKTDGVNQSNISGTKLCTFPFPICPIDEQKKVVEEIESRLSECDAIEQTVDNTLLQLNAMRQSILKEAFEGRL